MKKLRVGLIVSYKTTEADQARMAEHRSICNVSDELPAVVVADWSNGTANLKVLLDGVGAHWITSAHQGLFEGEWNFYPEDEVLTSEDLTEMIAQAYEAKADFAGVLDEIIQVKGEMVSELNKMLAEIDAKLEKIDNLFHSPIIMQEPVIEALDEPVEVNAKEV